MKIWPYIVMPIAFAMLMATSMTLLSMIWLPLGAVPVMLYAAAFVYVGRKTCVCGHRFIRHDKFGSCWPCHRAWHPHLVRLPTGQTKLRSHPCREFREAA